MTHMTISRFATAAVASGMALHGVTVHATTAYETSVLKANPAHVAYGGGATGYTDYPTLESAQAAQ